jgi:riboflavin biosynthesis pyrimidine reductase
MRLLVPAPDAIDLVGAYGRLGRVEPGRPGVRLKMIATVDGAAALHGRSGALGGPADKALFALLRSLADVILVGAGTVRAEGYGPVRLDEGARSRRSRWGLPAVPPIAVITRTCRLDWASLRLQLPHVLEADGNLFLRYRRR